MTTVDSALSGPIREGSPFAERPASRWDRVEAALTKFSEYLNPILVKETRQALKSKQFVITFTLLLLFGWAWSLIYLAFQYANLGNGIFYAPHGMPMLLGYYWVLSFPLLVIVPFTAFRSLSAEREDGTYELVAITTLTPRQIIGGKLGSAVLQMLVYLSALTPCMAFTYSLRGVDLIIIGMVTGYLFLASVFLSVIGLCYATVTSVRHWQMVLGVIFILQLVLVFIFGGSITSGVILESPAIPYRESWFWGLNFLIATALVGYSLLFYLAAMARITFPSDNRSTKLRVAMLGLQVAATGWFLWFWIVEQEIGFIFTLLAWSALHWWLMGGLMVGESPDISPRVRRGLPATFLGRMLLTWFNPGPGTGYMFMVGNALALLLVVIVAAIAADRLALRAQMNDRQILVPVLIFCYLTSYVGLTRLVMGLIDRFVVGGIFLSALLCFLFVIAGCFLPWVTQSFIYSMMRWTHEYSVFQVTNIPWTIAALEQGTLTDMPWGGFKWPLEAYILVLSAGAMILINMVLAAREVERQREAAPQRVQEEEAILHPKKAVAPVASSPWDEGDKARVN
jgi:hypothetical protein